MALPELFKIKQKRYIDANGKRCKKDAAGATEQITKSADWYADIKRSESASQRISRRKAGLPAPKRKRVKLCSDKRAAQEMLSDLVNGFERQAAGIVDYQAHTNQALGPMVDEFESHLRANGQTADYIDTTLARIQSVFDGCQFLRLVDIDHKKVEQWLYQKRNIETVAQSGKVKGAAKTYQEIADAFGVSITTVTYWRQKGAPIVARSINSLAKIGKWHAEFTRPKAIGTTTSDHYVTALKRFGNWLTDSEKTESNPFTRLKKLNDETELRKQRRVLSDTDFAELIRVANGSGKTFRDLTGIDRAMIYTLAAYTGLRASEIASLWPNSFDFGECPSVTVEAAYTKNSELAAIPLRADLAARLQKYIDARPIVAISIDRKPELIWPGTWSERGAEMIRIDLESAGIPYTDDTGKDYDFHALRHQFITGLARAGVSLKATQELARHSKPELTANVYTHLSIRDSAASVERMKAIPTGKRAGKPKAATG